VITIRLIDYFIIIISLIFQANQAALSITNINHYCCNTH